MSIKLYVGNLPENMTEETLKTMSAEAGPVASAKIITDRYTGQPRGFGFVEMETKADGQRAISMLNGKEVDGNTLKVNEARPQQRGGGRFGGGGGGGRFGGGGGGGGGGRFQRRY
jgi:cold-inducible RNA-binding protein